MQVRKLHTNPEIIPQSSSKLVNDASLMKLHSALEFFSQKATEFFLCKEGSYVEMEIKLSLLIGDMQSIVFYTYLPYIEISLVPFYAFYKI